MEQSTLKRHRKYLRKHFGELEGSVGGEVAGAAVQRGPADSPGRQEVGPDVDRLVGHLEAAEDAVQRRALRVPVPRDDAVLSEHLGEEEEGEWGGGGVQCNWPAESSLILSVFFLKPRAKTCHILQPFKILV